jgi:acyl-coenzyme A synthetase/AMP-(fatty) acid ligase
VGRNDQQVKLRGYRIELGEIEAALRQQQGVGEALVRVHTGGACSEYLVAYVVAEADAKLRFEQLRAALEQHLPGYMVPAVFIQLEAFPLTPNGKIDRQALPTPDVSEHMGKAAFVAATTPADQTLTSIWA